MKRFNLKEVWLISAMTGENVRPLLFKAAELLSHVPQSEFAVQEMPLYQLETDPKEFHIVKTEDGWQVIGEAIERAAAMTYWDYPQSVRRFQKILSALGVEDGLRKAGVQEGDTVYIGDFELEWSD
ncbi:MAG: Obg family GTPase CgtA, partial [Anaerolineales bacterium]